MNQLSRTYITFEVAQHTDDCLDDPCDFDKADDLINNVQNYINVNDSANDLARLLYANEIITNEKITIRFTELVGEDIIKDFNHSSPSPFTRRNLARVICGELKRIYCDQRPGWSFTHELHLYNVEELSSDRIVYVPNVVCVCK